MVHRIIIALCSVMVAINLLGNSLVCFVVLKNKTMRTTMNFLLVNLAVSDMIVGVFSTFRLVHVVQIRTYRKIYRGDRGI